jgi:hypothetical protein
MGLGALKNGLGIVGRTQEDSALTILISSRNGKTSFNTLSSAPTGGLPFRFGKFRHGMGLPLTKVARDF